MVSRYLRQALVQKAELLLQLVLLWHVLQGCATVTMIPADHLHDQRFAPDAAPIDHLYIYIDDWGTVSIQYIPIITGNLAGSGSLRLPRLFSDNVRI